MKSSYYVLFINAVSAIKISSAFIFVVFFRSFFAADSDLFDAHARGYVKDSGSSIWGQLLRGLDSVGLYNRHGVIFGLIVLSFFVIPYLVARLSLHEISLHKRKVFLSSFLITAMYPTLFLYSLDVNRDVFMVFCFLLALLPIKDFFESDKITTWRNVFRLIVFFSLSYFAYMLRHYLGFALFSAFFVCPFFSFSRHSIFFWCAVSINGLWGLRTLGFLDPLISYRAFFELYFSGARMNLGIPFDSIALFPVDLAMSTLYQLFGLFLVNIASILVFCLESIPFIYGLFYLFKNRRASNKFVDFLITFFVLYNAIWLIGNDNLGTAVRLRMFSYISVLISCMIVYQRKRIPLPPAPRKRGSRLLRRLLLPRKPIGMPVLLIERPKQDFAGKVCPLRTEVAEL